MGIALVAREDRQYRGAQHIALARRIGTGEEQRAALHPGIEQPAHVEELGEERQLPERGDGRLGIPLNVDSAPKGIHGHRAGVGDQRGAFALTRWVTGRIDHMRLLAPIFQRVSSARARSNCAF